MRTGWVRFKGAAVCSLNDLLQTPDVLMFLCSYTLTFDGFLPNSLPGLATLTLHLTLLFTQYLKEQKGKEKARKETHIITNSTSFISHYHYQVLPTCTTAEWLSLPTTKTNTTATTTSACMSHFGIPQHTLPARWPRVASDSSGLLKHLPVHTPNHTAGSFCSGKKKVNMTLNKGKGSAKRSHILHYVRNAEV